MYPILYDSLTIGEVPQHNGLGVLADCISCYTEEERNSINELTLEYPMSGIHAKDLSYMKFIKAKPNFTDDPQLFFIDRIGKELKGKFTVYCKHISYLLSGYPIISGSASDIVSACRLLNLSAPGWNIDTSKETIANFNIKEPSSVRSWFGGKEGSLLDVYGGGEWKYDNFHCKLWAHRGSDRNVTIRYGKNLLELTQEIDASNLYTAVICFYKNEETVMTGDQVFTGLTLNAPKVLTLDVSSEYETPPTEEMLTDKATEYINSHNLTAPSNNITLNFVQSGELKDRVDLCDTVTVFYEALGISVKKKCIRTKWDVLREKYIETEFGDAKTSLADTISSNDETLNDTVNAVEIAVNSIKSKKRVFTTLPIPPYDEGDLWVDNGAIYVCLTARPAGYVNFLGVTTTAIEEGSTVNSIEIDGETVAVQEGDVAVYDGETLIYMIGVWTEYATRVYIDWVLATNYADKSDIETAIQNATEIITGNSGGYVILHCSNPDPTADYNPPDELLIVNNLDIHNRATKIWRWNMGGLGYSSTGYDGTFATAITADGKFVADFITTGTLNANLANIINLDVNSFTGRQIVLGGSDDCSLEVHDTSTPPKTLIRIDKNGMECFGETVNNITPSVVFDKFGVTGYSNKDDKENTKIFWTREDNFCMKNAIVKNEASFGGEIRFVPINNGTNKGIAIVKVVT